MSRKSSVYQHYRFCDICINEYRYRKRIGESDVAAEVIIVSPEISESDRVPILRNPKRYYMKQPPIIVKDETDLYIVRPPNSFRTKHVEINILLSSFPTPVETEKLKIDMAGELISKAFEDGSGRTKSRMMNYNSFSENLTASDMQSVSRASTRSQRSRNKNRNEPKT